MVWVKNRILIETLLKDLILFTLTLCLLYLLCKRPNLWTKHLEKGTICHKWHRPVKLHNKQDDAWTAPKFNKDWHMYNVNFPDIQHIVKEVDVSSGMAGGPCLLRVEVEFADSLPCCKNITACLSNLAQKVVTSVYCLKYEWQVVWFVCNATNILCTIFVSSWQLLEMFYERDIQMDNW